MDNEFKIRTKEEALVKYPFLKDMKKEFAGMLMIELIKFMLVKDASIMEAIAMIATSK